ncbi:MAG: phage tail tape measure protein [Planctomycetota bacterium JB042]
MTATLEAIINAAGARTGAAEFDRATDQMTRSALSADRAVDKLDRGVANAGRTMAATGTAARGAAGGVTALTASVTGLNSSLATFLPGLGAVVAGFAGFATLRSGLGTFRELERELVTLRGVSGATAEEFERLSGKARDLGASTRFTATEAAEGLTFLARAGFSVQEQLDSVSSALDLAATSELSLAQAADVASNVLSTFGIATEQASRVVDDLTNVANNSNTSISQLAEALKFAGPVASATGKSLEETAAAIGVLGDRGIQASLAGTNIRGVLSALLGPSESAKEAIAELGLELDELDPSAHSLTTIFERLGHAGLSAGQAVEVFGRRNAGAALILASTTERVKELVDIQKENSGVTKQLAEERMKTLDGQILRVTSAWQGFTEALASSDTVLGTTRAALEAIVSALDSARNFVKDPYDIRFRLVTTSPLIRDILAGKRVFDAAAEGAKSTVDFLAAPKRTAKDFAPETPKPSAISEFLKDAAKRAREEAIGLFRRAEAAQAAAEADRERAEAAREAAKADEAAAEAARIASEMVTSGNRFPALQRGVRRTIEDTGFELEIAGLSSNRQQIEREVEAFRRAAEEAFPANDPENFGAVSDEAQRLVTDFRLMAEEIARINAESRETERLAQTFDEASGAIEGIIDAQSRSARLLSVEGDQRDLLAAKLKIEEELRRGLAAATTEQERASLRAAAAEAIASAESLDALRKQVELREQAFRVGTAGASRAAESLGRLAQNERDEIALLSASASERAAVSREIEIQRAATEGLAAALQIEDEAQRSAAVSRIEAAAQTARAVGAQADTLREAREAADQYAGTFTRALDQVVDKALQGTLTIRDLGAATRGLAADIAKVAIRRGVVEPAGNFIADKLTGIFAGEAVSAAAGAAGATAARDVAIDAQTVVVNGTIVAGGATAAGVVAAGASGAGPGALLGGLGALGSLFNTSATQDDPTVSTTSGFSASGFGSIFGNVFAGIGKSLGLGGGSPGSPPPAPPPAPPPSAPAPAPANGPGGFSGLLAGLNSLVGIGAAFTPISANSANVGGATGLTGENLEALAALGSPGLSSLGPTESQVLASIGEPENLGLVGGLQNAGGINPAALVVGAEQLTGESFPNIIFGGQRGIFQNVLPKNGAGNLPLAPVPGDVTSDLASVNPTFALLGALSGAVPGGTPAGAVLQAGGTFGNLSGAGFSETDLVTLQNTSLATGAVGGVSIQASPEYINGRAPGFTGLGPTGGFSGNIGRTNFTANLTSPEGAQGLNFLNSFFGLGSLFSFAKGGMFVGGRHVPVTAHALGSAFGNGALLDSPTFFASNEGLNVAGEAGTEIVAPAERDPRSGKLGVRVLGGAGGGTTLNVTNIFPGVKDRDGMRKSNQHTQQETRAALQGLTRG